MKALPPITDMGKRMMERTRATVAICNTREATEGLKMAGFLELFHPNLSDDKKRDLIRDVQVKYRERSP